MNDRTILFVDFDGVCHPDLYTVEFGKAKHLWSILRACPQVECVLSTSWREHYTFERMVEFVTFGGGEDLEHRFIGATPSLLREKNAYYGKPVYAREAECRAWILGNNRQLRHWLAIDDIADWFSPAPNPHFYWVNPKSGLTEEDARVIIEMMKGTKS